MSVDGPPPSWPCQHLSCCLGFRCILWGLTAQVGMESLGFPDRTGVWRLEAVRASVHVWVVRGPGPVSSRLAPEWESEPGFQGPCYTPHAPSCPAWALGGLL